MRAQTPQKRSTAALGRGILIAEIAILVLVIAWAVIGPQLDWGLALVLVVMFAIPITIIGYAAPVLALAGIGTAIAMLRRGQHALMSAFLILLAVILIGGPIYIRLNPEVMMMFPDSVEGVSIPDERFDALSKRFEKPQRVKDVHNLNSLVLEEDLRVYANQPDELRHEFEAFALAELVDRKVTVVLPDRETFVEEYCCKNTDSERDVITMAEVYLDGHLLSDGGFKHIDTARK